MSKYSFAGKSIFNNKDNKRILYTGIVVSNSDNNDANRIKVRIQGVDDSFTDEELPFAFPLLQKFVHVIPKVGEAVTILTPDMSNPYLDRQYIGPIISQPQMLNRDLYVAGATSGFDTGFINFKESPTSIPESRGVYPKKEEIAFQGRDNTDIIMKSKEILLRAGKHDSTPINGSVPQFNTKNPTYIQIKHDVKIFNESTQKDDNTGVINFVADKINLLTHKDGAPRFILNDQDSMITDAEMNKILADAHPLPFGDLLIKYLIMQRNAFINHVHSYHGNKAQDLSGADDIDKYLEFDLNSLLSKNIRIN